METNSDIYCKKCGGTANALLPPKPFYPCQRCGGEGIEIKVFVERSCVGMPVAERAAYQWTLSSAREKLKADNANTYTCWYFLVAAVKLVRRFGKPAAAYDDSDDSDFWKQMSKNIWVYYRKWWKNTTDREIITAWLKSAPCPHACLYQPKDKHAPHCKRPVLIEKLQTSHKAL